MEVLQVIGCFSPPRLFGGSQRVVLNISKELVRKGHSVTVFTSDMENLETRQRERLSEYYGIRIRFFANMSTLLSRISRVVITPGMIPVLKKEIANFDVVHLHDSRSIQHVLVQRYAEKAQVPYVFQAHGSMPRMATERNLKLIYDKAVGKRILSGASRIIALNSKEVQQFISLGVSKKRITVMRNGIDLSEYENLPSKGFFKTKFGIKREEKIVLYLGRIHSIKGIDLLVKAFASITKELEDTKLVIVGPDDGFLNQLKFLIKALSLGKRVLITGPLYGKDKVGAYTDADVFVLPSRYDMFPMSVLEAVACGTPIVLTENCEIAEWLGDKVGLVVKFDPDYLGKALLDIVSNEDVQNSFKENCKTVIQEFSISKIVSKLERVYEQVIAGSRQEYEK